MASISMASIALASISMASIALAANVVICAKIYEKLYGISPDRDLTGLGYAAYYAAAFTMSLTTGVSVIYVISSIVC
jgi:hypothetical protein